MISAAQIYAVLGNETLWDATRRCHDVLQQTGLPHAVAGGVAVCLHGYQRNTVDLDLLVRRADAEAVRTNLEQSGFRWNPDGAEFRSPAGVPVRLLIAGDRAGKESEIPLPDPADPRTVTELEGFPVLSLARLIEMKIACGQGDLRRTHKDWADVVELIAAHQLGRSFARHLHKSVRKVFRDLVLNACGGTE